MIKTRVFTDKNYKGVWFNGKTIRIALDPSKPIEELDYPEFYDVKITSRCDGECPYCYMDSKKEEEHYKDIVTKVKDFFGPMSENQRPFQVAIGGGEPTSHPDFIPLLQTFKKLGIEPNYTTNGMCLSQKIVNATKQFCGGVAVSCHPHLGEYWESALVRLSEAGIKTNLHLIISDQESIDYFSEIYEKFKEDVDYFVLLPYGAQGRADKKEINWEYLLTKLPEDCTKIAFGANFHHYLCNTKHNIRVSLYEPEIMSKFLDLKDMSIHKSSFSLNS